MSDVTTAAVSSLCSELIAQLRDGPVARNVRTIHDKLGEPLRVAIGGRLKAGKSTLVNALVGQRVAPVDVGECTKAIYWYRYGDQSRIQVSPIGGPPYDIGFVNGTVPADLGRAPEAIEKVEVWLRVPALKDMVIIDTPGLETLNQQYSEKTKEYLGIGESDQRAVSQADVLVYLMTQPREGDAWTLQTFRSAFPGAQLSALNAIGVLSRIDTLSGDDDPWPAARRHTATYSGKLAAVLSTITPVIGKLAETVECGGLTESHFNDILAIAALPPKSWVRMRMSADRFATYDGCDIPVERRDELLSLLGFYAAKQSVEWVRAGECTSLGQLLERLRALSGIDELQRQFAATFASRAAVLKAGVAAAQLASLYWSHRAVEPALDDLLDRLERIERHPAMHQLQEAKVMRLIAGGQVRLADSHLDEIRRVMTEVHPARRLGLPEDTPPAELAAAAAAREAEWNGIEQMSRFSQREVPRTVKLSYALVRESIR